MLQGVRTDKVRFGVYEADLRAGELRKHGIRIHLQRQPFKVLAALVEHPGELVTREDLRQRIWGPEVVVDFDHSLGTAINKLREALCDSADTPQYIETLAKRGFRFIAPVEPIIIPPPREIEKPVVIAPPIPAPIVIETLPAPVTSTRAPVAAPLVSAQPVGRKWPIGWMAGIAAAASLLSFWLAGSANAPALVRFNQITTDYPIYPGETEIERFPGVATDGLRVFFSDFQDGRVGLAYVLIGGGEVHRFVTPPEILRPSVADISRDGSQLLIRSMMWAETEQPLWIAPSTGGSARRLANILAHDAAWTPDRRSILYATGQDLFLIGLDGGASQKIASLSGRAYWLRYSPDGSIVRFTVLDPKTRATSIWEMPADGKNPHPMLPDWSNPSSECCGDWTAGGSHFVFQSSHSGRPNIWGQREAALLRRFRGAPFEITAGPLNYIAPVPALRGDSIFSIGANIRRELFHYNLSTHRSEPYLSNVKGAGRSEPSHHGDQIAWISNTDGSLWRGKADGSERVQLVAAPLTVYMARWSPDDRRLLVMAKQRGTPYQLYTISADGGDLQPVFQENRNQADPDWSPAANAIVFGRLPNYAAEANSPKDIRVIDLNTKAVSALRDSTGMFSPRWSPDGRYIAAMTLDQHRLMVFDRIVEKWSVLADGLIHNPVWAHDGKAIFFQDLQDDQVPVIRVSIADHRLEHVFDRNVASPADRITFWGLAADGGPVGSFLFYSADMYRLDWTGGK
jgi:Tol biopolymer transport system component/DNA-binding winged helix-turn-helix (wHTH) protein